MNQITAITTKTNLPFKDLTIKAMLNISLWMVRFGLAIGWIALIIIFPWALIGLDDLDELVS